MNTKHISFTTHISNKNNYPETVTSIDETPIHDQPPGKNSGDEGEENVAVVKIVEFLSFPICMISF